MPVVSAHAPLKLHVFSLRHTCYHKCSKRKEKEKEVMQFQERTRRLTRELSGQTAVVTSEASIFYLTGFRTTARRPKQIGPTAVVTGADTVLIAPAKW
jgi:hypothetical protein